MRLKKVKKKKIVHIIMLVVVYEYKFCNLMDDLY